MQMSAGPTPANPRKAENLLLKISSLSTHDEKLWRHNSALPLAHPKGISGHIMAKTLLGSVAVRQRPGERATAPAEWLENHD